MSNAAKLGFLPGELGRGAWHGSLAGELGRGAWQGSLAGELGRGAVVSKWNTNFKSCVPARQAGKGRKFSRALSKLQKNCHLSRPQPAASIAIVLEAGNVKVTGTSVLPVPLFYRTSVLPVDGKTRGRNHTMKSQRDTTPKAHVAGDAIPGQRPIR